MNSEKMSLEKQKTCSHRLRAGKMQYKKKSIISFYELCSNCSLCEINILSQITYLLYRIYVYFYFFFRFIEFGYIFRFLIRFSVPLLACAKINYGSWANTRTQQIKKIVCCLLDLYTITSIPLNQAKKKGKYNNKRRRQIRSELL